MGFYASAQLVRDAKEHGVEVLPPDVGFSDWDTMLEVRPGQSRKAVRLGLREIKGFKEADAARLVAARAGGGRILDAEDLKRRARLNARAMDLLSDGDAMGSLHLDRRQALWRAKGLAEHALPLFEHASEYGPEVDPALPEMPLSEQVVHDYARLRLSLKAHPVSFFRDELAEKRFMTSQALKTAPNGARVDIAGLVLVRQKPGTAKGVLFVTVEDEQGSANIIVWPKIFERFRRETLAAKFMGIRGRLQREHGVIHVIADRVTNLNHRLAELSDENRPFYQALARADEHQSPREDSKLTQASDRALAQQRTTRAFANSRDFH
jgi:error-prone DNA polymerase